MPRRCISLLLLAVLLGGLLYPRLAHGQETQPTRILHAVFSSSSEGVVTDVVVDVTVDPEGGEAVIEVSRYRPTCANNGCPLVLFHAFNQVPLAADALQTTGQLDTVRLQATGPVDEPLVPGIGTVSLDLTWTAVGSLVRDDHEEGERFRRARASGAVRAGTTNFTPRDSVDATITEW
jgi:hypothetical protein